MRPNIKNCGAELISESFLCSSGLDVLNNNRELVRAQWTWTRPIKRRDQYINGPNQIGGAVTKETSPEMWKKAKPSKPYSILFSFPFPFYWAICWQSKYQKNIKLELAIKDYHGSQIKLKILILIILTGSWDGDFISMFLLRPLRSQARLKLSTGSSTLQLCYYWYLPVGVRCSDGCRRCILLAYEWSKSLPDSRHLGKERTKQTTSNDR